ncbi:MAG: hypothetical protein WD873_03175 [Candidatus Hydrogenedentales bacterium]
MLAAAESPAEETLPLPAIPAPPVHVFATPFQAAPPLRLEGIAFIQDDQVVTEAPVRLRGTAPLAVDTYWVAPVTACAVQVPITLQFWSANGLISVETDASIGPVDGEEPWPPGSMRKQRIEVDFAPVARVISGDAALTVSIVEQDSENVVLHPLLFQPLHITPSIGARQVGLQNLELRVGRPFHDMSLSFRLGAGAETTLDVPARMQRNVDQIGVVSAFSYGNLPQNRGMFELTAADASGEQFSWTARSGVEIARIDYDFYPTGTLDHTRLTPLESWTADYLNAGGQSFSKHKYLALFTVPENFTVASLTFRSLNPYVVDVYDVVLVPNNNAN